MVETISLDDLLAEHDAPKLVHFLSLDTEGSELAILKGASFNQFKFGLICCEHNNSGSLTALTNYLAAYGFVLLDELLMISGGDAWFLHSDFIETKSQRTQARWSSS